MTKNALYWVKQLELTPHPEGGYYKETYRCANTINVSDKEKRNISTAIYFLLQGNDISHFHRIKSDELWFFHEGTTLEIIILNDSEVEKIFLGNNPEAGEQLQAVIPAGKWFGARLLKKEGYSLVSCTVAPGFDFKDFELAKRNELLLQFPEHLQLIDEMALE